MHQKIDKNISINFVGSLHKSNLFLFNVGLIFHNRMPMLGAIYLSKKFFF